MKKALLFLSMLVVVAATVVIFGLVADVSPSLMAGTTVVIFTILLLVLYAVGETGRRSEFAGTAGTVLVMLLNLFAVVLVMATLMKNDRLLSLVGGMHQGMFLAGISAAFSVFMDALMLRSIEDALSDPESGVFNASRQRN